jgi:nitrous oxide reductase accessory protein NosL
MKKTVAVMTCLLVALSFSPLFSASFQDQHDHPSCKHCGMDRTKFAHSRMLVAYQDGEQVGTCSLHCTIRELNGSGGRRLKAIMVADYDTHKLLLSDEAIWVAGGDKQGVMTMRAKWAFATPEAARTFVTEHGGAVTTAEQAMQAGSDDMARDMERMKRMKQKKAGMKQ